MINYWKCAMNVTWIITHDKFSYFLFFRECPKQDSNLGSMTLCYLNFQLLINPLSTTAGKSLKWPTIDFVLPVLFLFSIPNLYSKPSLVNKIGFWLIFAYFRRKFFVYYYYFLFCYLCFLEKIPQNKSKNSINIFGGFTSSFWVV